MRTIYKYQLNITDEQKLKLPQGFKILSTAVQHDTICIWVEVPDTEPTDDIVVHIRGTGHAMPTGYANTHFIGTVLMHNGALVFHIFWSRIDA